MPNLNAPDLPAGALDRLHDVGIDWQPRPDGTTTLTAPGLSHDVAVVVHARAGSPAAGLVDGARSTGLPVLVAADHVSSRLAPLLREQDLHYVDRSGNASLQLPGLVVEISGRQRSSQPRPRGTGPTATNSGIRVLLVVLSDPERGSIWTVRSLAAAAGVSLGSAQTVLADLKSAGHLTPAGLARTRQLFDAWVAGYLAMGRLRTARLAFQHRRGWYSDADVRHAIALDQAALSGEDAAELLGLPLRGTSGVVYTPGSFGPVVRAARLRRDDAGALMVRDMWWAADGSTLAPSPLIYADLVASRDPRQSDVAELLRSEDALLRRLDAD